MGLFCCFGGGKPRGSRVDLKNPNTAREPRVKQPEEARAPSESSEEESSSSEASSNRGGPNDSFLRLPGSHLGRTKSQEARHKRNAIRPGVFRQYSTIFLLLTDKQGGEVSAQELAQRLNLELVHAHDMMQEADLNNNGLMDFDEFVGMIVKKDPKARANKHGKARKSRKRSAEELHNGELLRYKMLYDLIDTNKDEYLDADELAVVLHLDPYLKSIMQQIGADQSVITFEVFVQVMQFYEEALEREFDKPLQTSPRKHHQAPGNGEAGEANPGGGGAGDGCDGSAGAGGGDGVGVELAAHRRVSAQDDTVQSLLRVFAVFEGSTQVSVLRALRYMEDMMHSGKKQHQELDNDDYALHFDLQRVLVAQGKENLSQVQFMELLNKHPNTLLLKPSCKQELAGHFLMVTDEHGQHQALEEVELAKRLALRKKLDDRKARQQAALGRLTAEERDVYEKVFEFMDRDESLTLSEDDIVGVIEFLTEKGASDEQVLPFHNLLDGMQQSKEPEDLTFEDFVVAIEDDQSITVGQLARLIVKFM